MNEVLHANIFFFITGIAVIVFTALLSVALFHGIKVLKSLRRIMDRIERGTEVIADDLEQVRSYITEDGFVKRVVMSLTGTGRKSAEKEHKARAGEKKKTELKIKGEA